MRPTVLLLLGTAVFAQDRLRITETAGIPRVNEPACLESRCWFVTIGARESKVISRFDSAPATSLRMQQTDEVGFLIENDVFLADHSSQIYQEQPEDSGTLRGLEYRRVPVRLERQPNRMHWAPSFQRAGAKAYTSIATWWPVQRHLGEKSPGLFTFLREGHHQLYPEIRLKAEYRYFAFVPYFLFRATMTVQKPIEMHWLRNQEMTMDDLFTHAAFPQDGKPVVVTFAERKPLLEKNPLPVDLPWIAFLNLEKGYGYGAVVLRHQASRTAGAKMSINDGARNGRYWDRRLIDQRTTRLQPGDTFEEETAYVLFRCTREAPLAEFFDWEQRIRNPLQVAPAP